MPLKGKSFKEIVKTEIAAGKPQKTAVAIAYSVTGKDKKNSANCEICETKLTEANRGSLPGLCTACSKEVESYEKEEKRKNEARDRFDSMEMRAQRGTERYASKKRNLDEASEDEKEEQFDELQRKRDQNY